MKINKWLLLGVTALLVTVFLWGAHWYRKGETQKLDAVTRANEEILVRPYSPTLGPSDARVTVVEFLDPQCEACGALYPVVKGVLKEFEGKVRYVVRYMTFHQHSAYAVTALEAARKQGKYWEALETFFARQPEWASHQNARPELLMEYLKELGCNVDTVKAAMADSEGQSKIAQDKQDGEKLQVNRTPSFFVNGTRVERLGQEELRSAIQAAL